MKNITLSVIIVYRWRYVGKLFGTELRVRVEFDFSFSFLYLALNFDFNVVFLVFYKMQHYDMFGDP